MGDFAGPFKEAGRDIAVGLAFSVVGLWGDASGAGEEKGSVEDIRCGMVDRKDLDEADAGSEGRGTGCWDLI